MSNTYDNWERLVAAVLKRHQIWELCHAVSRSTSFSSVLSLEAADFDRDLRYCSDESMTSNMHNILDEWVVQKYEPGVYITVAAHSDGTRWIQRTQFSRSKFKPREAEAWWAENLKKVAEKYNAKLRIGGKLSQEQYEPGVYITLKTYGDGSTELERARFSRRRFEEKEADSWWLNNRAKVYQKYNVRLHTLVRRH